MRDELQNKQGPPTRFPFRQGNRIICDRPLTSSEMIARREEKIALDKARRYRKVKSRESREVDTDNIQPVDKVATPPEDAADTDTQVEKTKPKSATKPRRKKPADGDTEGS